VDSFTSRAFAGNPAAVCLVAPSRQLSDREMLLIAAEMNLSETAFLTPLPDVPLDPHSAGGASSASPMVPAFGLRWFTPAVEVPLCGHATLAVAHVLFFEVPRRAEADPNSVSALFARVYKDSVVSFSTLSGRLDVRLASPERLLELDFPANSPEPLPLESPLASRIPAALSVPHATVAGLAYSPTTRKLLIEFADAATLADIRLNHEALTSIDYGAERVVRGVIATVDTRHLDTDKDATLLRYANTHFASRYFAPWVGIPEDPVTGTWNLTPCSPLLLLLLPTMSLRMTPTSNATHSRHITGSAHTVLGPYWASKFNLRELQAFQASARGGHLTLHLPKDSTRILIQGHATTMLSGTLTLPQ